MTYASAPQPGGRLGTWQAFGSGVVLEDGRLLARSVAAGRAVQPTPTMLVDFAALDGADDAQVLDYAQRWGLFDLCGHGLLRGHGWTEVPVSLLVAADLASFDPRCPTLHGEPVAAWRYWIREAGALLRVIARLRRRLRADPADLLILGEAGPWATDYSTPDNRLAYYAFRGFRLDTIETHRVIAGEAITTWLAFTRASNHLVWAKGGPRLDFGGEGLLGGLGLQLLQVVAGVRGLDWCASCTKLFIVKRVTKYPAYCNSCRKLGVPQRSAHEQWYGQKRVDPAWRESEAKRLRDYRAKKKTKEHMAPEP